MIFPVKRVKEELINEFAVSKMNIDDFSKMHSIQPEALKSWITEIFCESGQKDNQKEIENNYDAMTIGDMADELS